MIPFKQIDTFIFDMDGVLINSEPLWKEAEIKVFKTVGIDFLAVGGEKTVGLRIDEVINYWYDQHPWNNKSKQEVVDEIMREMVRGIEQSGQAMKGVYTILETLKSKNYKIGLASSSYNVLIKATLKALKLEDFFDVIVSAEDLPYGKPHPEIYLKAAQMLNSQPPKCLVIEDSLNGVLAGKSAKMNVVAIPDGTHSPDPRIILADLQLNDLNELVECLKKQA